MPFYEYACGRCGTFTDMVSMSAYLEPRPCPDCNASSPRVAVTAPAMSVRGAGFRAAEVNERSSHEPKRSHSAGCGCCKPMAGKKPPGQVKSGGSRPWMISH